MSELFLEVELLLPKYYASKLDGSGWVVKCMPFGDFFKTCTCTSCKTYGLYWHPDDPNCWDTKLMKELSYSEGLEIEKIVLGIR